MSDRRYKTMSDIEQEMADLVEWHHDPNADSESEDVHESAVHLLKRSLELTGGDAGRAIVEMFEALDSELSE